MKKIAFLVMALFLPFVSVKSDPVDIRLIPVRHAGGSRTSVPSVSADMENGIITIDVDRYIGNVCVKINNEYGDSLMVNSCYVSGQSFLEFNVSQLSEGSYSIVVELEGGNVYIGCFDIML